MATDLDRPDEALAALGRIESLLRQTDESQVWVPYFGEKIRAHDALGQQREAGAAVDALIAHLGARSGSDRGGRYYPELATALCWLLSDPAARSSERQAQLGELLEHDVATLDTPEARAFLAETRALAAGAAGDLEAAADSLRSLREFWREIGRPLDEMRVALRLAAVRAAAGDSEAARRLRAEVASRRAEIGAELGAEAATG